MIHQVAVFFAVLYIRLLLAALVLLGCLGCANTTRSDVRLDNVGPVHFRLVGCYNMDSGSAVVVDADGSVPLAGVPVPVGLDLVSTAMSGAASIDIRNASSVTFEVLGTGNQNGKSYETRTKAGERVLIGEVVSELSADPE